MREWIKVTDRMPTTPSAVLVVIKGKWGYPDIKERIIKAAARVSTGSEELTHWMDDRGHFIQNKDVTHWMPFPELPVD